MSCRVPDAVRRLALQSWQFEYQWFTLFYELFIFLWVSALVIMPSANPALCPPNPRRRACMCCYDTCYQLHMTVKDPTTSYLPPEWDVQNILTRQWMWVTCAHQIFMLRHPDRLYVCYDAKQSACRRVVVQTLAVARSWER